MEFVLSCFGDSDMVGVNLPCHVFFVGLPSDICDVMFSVASVQPFSIVLNVVLYRLISFYNI